MSIKTTLNHKCFWKCYTLEWIDFPFNPIEDIDTRIIVRKLDHPVGSHTSSELCDFFFYKKNTDEFPKGFWLRSESRSTLLYYIITHNNFENCVRQPHFQCSVGTDWWYVFSSLFFVFVFHCCALCHSS